MRIKKISTIVTASTLLLTLVSCGKDSKSTGKRDSSVSPVCTTIQCLSSINWKINLQGQVFPEKTRLEIDGESILDECLGKQQYRIDRESAPQSIVLDNFKVPKNGASLSLKIVDQGWDCSKENVFFTSENVSYEISKDLASPEIVINL